MTLTLERLNEVLEFNPTTNEWRWIKPIAYKMKPNDIAGGAIKCSQIRYICIDGKQFRSDHLVYFRNNGGTWPPKIVRKKKQKRERKQGPSKLTPVRGAVNFRGVYKYIDGKRYVAKYNRRHGDKRIEKWIGVFDSAIEASEAFEEFVENLRICDAISASLIDVGETRVSEVEPNRSKCSFMTTL